MLLIEVITQCLRKWLSVGLQTKWLWFQVPPQSLNSHIFRLFRAESSFILRQLESIDSV